MKTVVAVAVAVMLIASIAVADEPQVLNLWPGEVPGEKGDIGEEKELPDTSNRPIKRITNVTKPTITVFRPAKDKDTGAAVLICPGGGYGILAWDLEGTEIAEWLNSIGVTGVVLKYRVPRRKDLPKHQAPLQDAQRAMSLVRSHAKEWGIDPEKIGVLGFSAGGHLSATLSTNYEKRTYSPQDEVDQVSCRPSFTVLVYPAYLLEKDELASELVVDSKTPPMFFAHAYNDGIGPENSAILFLALKKQKVPAELHVYHDGGHGFGLRKTASPSHSWPARCEEWLRVRGVIPKKE